MLKYQVRVIHYVEFGAILKIHVNVEVYDFLHYTLILHMCTRMNKAVQLLGISILYTPHSRQTFDLLYANNIL